jgi:hypothetical protein
MENQNNGNSHPTENTKPERARQQRLTDEVPLIDNSFPKQLQRKRRLSKESAQENGFKILCCCGNYLTLHSSFQMPSIKPKNLAVDPVVTCLDSSRAIIESESESLIGAEETVIHDQERQQQQQEQQRPSPVHVKTEPIEASPDSQKPLSVLIKLTNLRRNIQKHQVENLFRNFFGIQRINVRSSVAGTGAAIVVMETIALANELLDYLKVPGVVDYNCDQPVKGEILSPQNDSFLDAFVKNETEPKPPTGAARPKFIPSCHHTNRGGPTERKTNDRIPNSISPRHSSPVEGSQRKEGDDRWGGRTENGRRGGRSFGGNSSSYLTSNERRSAESEALKRKSSQFQEGHTAQPTAKSAKRDGWLGLALNEFLKTSRSSEQEEEGARHS